MYLCNPALPNRAWSYCSCGKSAVHLCEVGCWGSKTSRHSMLRLHSSVIVMPYRNVVLELTFSRTQKIASTLFVTPLYGIQFGKRRNLWNTKTKSVKQNRGARCPQRRILEDFLSCNAKIMCVTCFELQIKMYHECHFQNVHAVCEHNEHFWRLEHIKSMPLFEIYRAFESQSVQIRNASNTPATWKQCVNILCVKLKPAAMSIFQKAVGAHYALAHRFALELTACAGKIRFWK